MAFWNRVRFQSPFSLLNPSTSSLPYHDSENLQVASRIAQGKNSVMYTRDWRSALRTPPTYRIGNRMFRFNYHFGLLLALIVFIFYMCYSYMSPSSTPLTTDGDFLKKYSTSTSYNKISDSKSISNNNDNLKNVVDFDVKKQNTVPYNKTYPLTPPIKTRGGVETYRIAIIADLDTKSKLTKENGDIVWRSYLKKGYISHTSSKHDVRITWDSDKPLPLDTGFSLKGRGMELSELVTFNGRLLSFDDRTGLIYELVNDKPIPWVILLDGNGKNSKGFKAEWATVKEETLFVGSIGKEWTTSSGDFENENPMFVKSVTMNGEIKSHDWSRNYKMLRQQSQQITWPGYMIHESGVWSDVHKKWFFLPRRCSRDKYNETRDEFMGCNVLIAANENFTKIETTLLETKAEARTHGFSSFKFVPGTQESIILAIKSEELAGKTSTYITAFDIDGKILLQEQKVESDYKYEGLEFI